MPQSPSAEDIGRRPVRIGRQVRMPVDRPRRQLSREPLAAFGTANASHADVGSPLNRRFNLDWIWLVFDPRCRSACAACSSTVRASRFEIFVARDIGLPSGFPLLHQAALFAPHDDNLGSETGSQSFADRSGILLFDEPEIGMDQDAWADVADIVEMSKRCHRRGLAVLAARDTDGDGRASLDQVCNRRRDGDGTS